MENISPALRLLWSALGAAAGIALALSLVRPPASPFLLASLGSSAVFLFGLTRAPAGPRAPPWKTPQPQFITYQAWISVQSNGASSERKPVALDRLKDKFVPEPIDLRFVEAISKLEEYFEAKLLKLVNAELFSKAAGTTFFHSYRGL